jgi:hypothetical protein
MRAYPHRRDLFLCHAWDDRQAAAKDFHDLLVNFGASVWVSEEEHRPRQVVAPRDRQGSCELRIGIVLMTPAMLKSLAAEGIADKEVFVLRATDRVIPVAHNTTFDALRGVSPMLGAVRSEHREVVTA